MVRPLTPYSQFQDEYVGEYLSKGPKSTPVRCDRFISNEDFEAFEKREEYIRFFARILETPLRPKPFIPRLFSLRSAFNHVKSLTDNQVHELLLKYIGKDVLGVLKKVRDIDLRKFLALLSWISDDARFTIYGSPLVDAVVDEETNEFQFITIMLPECNADEWGDIVKEIKGEMERAGLVDMVGKVAIVCLQGLQELVS